MRFTQVNKTFIYISVLLLIGACSPQELGYSEYVQFLRSEGSGLTKKNNLGNRSIEVMYTPSVLLAEQDRRVVSIREKKDYKDVLTFTVYLSKEEDRPIEYEGVKSKSAFTQNVLDLNFSMDKLWYLKGGNGELVPKITFYENEYDLSGKRKLVIVFSKDEVEEQLGEQDLDLVYVDEVYNSGIHHFLFKRKDIKNIPTLTGL